MWQRPSNGYITQSIRRCSQWALESVWKWAMRSCLCVPVIPRQRSRSGSWGIIEELHFTIDLFAIYITKPHPPERVLVFMLPSSSSQGNRIRGQCRSDRWYSRQKWFPLGCGPSVHPSSAPQFHLAPRKKNLFQRSLIGQWFSHLTWNFFMFRASGS